MRCGGWYRRKWRTGSPRRLPEKGYENWLAMETKRRKVLWRLVLALGVLGRNPSRSRRRCVVVDNHRNSKLRCGVVCRATPIRPASIVQVDPDVADLHRTGGCGSGAAIARTGEPHPSIHPWVGVGGWVDPWKRGFPWVDGRDEEGGRSVAGMGMGRTGRRGRRWGWGSTVAAEIGEESGVGEEEQFVGSSAGLHSSSTSS